MKRILLALGFALTFLKFAYADEKPLQGGPAAECGKKPTIEEQKACMKALMESYIGKQRRARGER